MRSLFVRRLMQTALLVTLPVAMIGANVSAQGATSPFGPGTPRVRLTLWRGMLDGHLIVQSSDSVLLQTATGSGETQQFRQRWVPLSCVQRAEVANGERSSGASGAHYALAGAFVGGLAGGLAGLLHGHAQEGAHVYEPPIDVDRWHNARIGLTIGIVPGALVGAFYGSRNRLAAWQPVDLGVRRSYGGLMDDACRGLL